MQLSGLQHGKDRKLDFDPCSVSYFNNGEYLLVGGSDKKVTLMTKEGVKIMELCGKDDWVWAAKARPKQNYVAVACNDGTVSLHQLIFATVHGLYQVRRGGVSTLAFSRCVSAAVGCSSQWRRALYSVPLSLCLLPTSLWQLMP
jgi:hypothetical protein